MAGCATDCCTGYKAYIHLIHKIIRMLFYLSACFISRMSTVFSVAIDESFLQLLVASLCDRCVVALPEDSSIVFPVEAFWRKFFLYFSKLRVLRVPWK